MILEPPIWIANILEQHVEDLGALWNQRLLNSAAETYARRSLCRLDERILAHLDALVLAGDDALPLLEPLLAADYGGALTAGLVMRISGPKHQEKILAAFKAGAGPALDGLAQALAWTPLQTLKDPLSGLAKEAGGGTPASFAALGVLAAHDALRPHESVLDGLFGHADPAVRLQAWRACRNLAVPRPPLMYQKGMLDAEPAVKVEALWASAWAAQKPVLAQVRLAALKPTAGALPLLHLFAVLAQPEDLPVIQNLAKAEVLGPARFELLGRSGFPGVAPLLIAAMKGKDAASAAVAAQAFTSLTHFDPTTGKRVTLQISKDPVEQAFAPEVQVPDPAAAEAFWNNREKSLSALPRISHGQPVDPSLAPIPASLMQIDCRSYLDVHLRHHFHSGAPKRMGDYLKFSTTPA